MAYTDSDLTFTAEPNRKERDDLLQRLEDEQAEMRLDLLVKVWQAT